MWALRKSRLLKRQVMDFTKGYKERAGQETAERYLDAVEDAITFIQTKPLACRSITK